MRVCKYECACRYEYAHVCVCKYECACACACRYEYARVGVHAGVVLCSVEMRVM